MSSLLTYSLTHSLNNSLTHSLTRSFTHILSHKGNLQELPKTIAILGGGVIAIEYASVLSKLSLGVTVIAKTYLPGTNHIWTY